MCILFCNPGAFAQQRFSESLALLISDEFTDENLGDYVVSGSPESVIVDGGMLSVSDGAMVTRDANAHQTIVVEFDIRVPNDVPDDKFLDFNFGFVVNGIRFQCVCDWYPEVESPVVNVKFQTLTQDGEWIWSHSAESPVGDVNGRWRLSCTDGVLSADKDGRRLFEHFMFAGPLVEFGQIEIGSRGVPVRFDRLTCRGNRLSTDQRARLLGYAGRSDVLRAARAASADLRHAQATAPWRQCTQDWPTSDALTTHVAFVQMQAGLAEINNGSVLDGLQRIGRAWPEIVNALPANHPRVIAGAAMLRDAHNFLIEQATDRHQLVQWQASLDEMWAAWTELSWLGKASLGQQRSAVIARWRRVAALDDLQLKGLNQLLRNASFARAQFAQGNVTPALRHAEASLRELNTWRAQAGDRSELLLEDHADLLTLAACCRFLSPNFDRDDIQRKIREANGYYETSLPAEHPKRLTAAYNAACVDYLNGDWMQADTSLRQSLQNSMKWLGDNAPETLETQASFGMLNVILGQTQDAEQMQQDLLWPYAELVGTGWLPTPTSRLDAFCKRQELLEHPTLVMVFMAAAAGPSEADPLASHADSLALARIASRIDQVTPPFGNTPWGDPGRRAQQVIDSLAPANSPLRVMSKWLGFERLSDQQMARHFAHPWSVWLGRDYDSVNASDTPPVTPIEIPNEYQQQRRRNLEATLQRSIEVFGDDHPESAWCRESLALMNYNLGRFNQARDHSNKSAETFGQRLGPQHRRTLTMKNTTAIIDYYRQDLQSSFAILKQNVHDRRESLGAQDLDTLRSLSDLSVVARSLGEYQIARTLIELAIKDWPREDEAANLMMAAKMVFYRRIALVNRCVLQAESGDYASAEAGFQHLLQQPEFEDLQREVLLSLSSIAMMKDDYRTAQQYLLESEQLLLQDPYVRVDPQLDHALGVVHRELGDFDQARQYLEKALQHRRDNKFGPAYDLGDNLTSIGILEQKVGSLDKALQYYTEAAGNYIERLGPIGLRQADAARRVALAARLLGNNKLAVSAGERALQMKLQLSDSLAASLSEAETMLFANSLTELEPLLSGLSVDRDKNAAAALESVWRRKAIAARLIESRHHRLRDSDNLQSQPSLERLRIVRRELATLLGPQFSTTLLTGSSLGAIPPDHFDAQREERINELTSEKESLERTLARLAGSGGPSVASSVDDVIAAMPPETALIEFVKVNIWPTVSGKPASDKELKPEARFQLFMLVKDSSNRSQLSWHDLGPASEIDSLVEDVRSWIELESRRIRGVTVVRDHTKQQEYHLAYKRAGKKLTDTWASQIAKSRHLYLVPDGSLHGLPWAALPGHDSMYLIENASLSLLDRGPELIRRKTPDEVAGRLLMVGNLSYGERLDEAPQRLRWNSLQGTDQELRSIGRMVSERFTPTILQDAEANEDATTAAMKAASIVHFATHGFYTPDDSTAASTGSLNWRDPMLASAVGRNPLSRCGVVLANANQLPKLDADGIPYGNDGLLTGEELCDLDLRGVHLVVFSACETGLGRIADNEGTLGLHRAVSTAGAASMIGSLWQVSDDATTQLMTEFYRNWTVQDIGSAEALRRAQLEMLKGVGNDNSPQFTAPFYWAAFVVAGDPDVTP